MSKPSKLKSVYPGTPEWRAWWSYSEKSPRLRRRLSDCLAVQAPYRARSLYPPDGVNRRGLKKARRPIQVLGAPGPDWRRGLQPKSKAGGKKIKIAPGSAQWRAWLKYFEGTKAASRMRECESAGRAFDVPTRWPPHETVAEQKRRRLLAKREVLREDALATARTGGTPSIRGAENLDVRRVVDPTEGTRLVHVGKGAPLALPVPDAKARPRVASLRDDPVGKMAKLGRLGIGADRDVRLMAARKWQEFYGLAAADGGVDPFVEAVDGGRVDDVAEIRLTAVKALSRASRVLGMRNENLVFHVLGAGCSIEEYLKKMGMFDGSATHRQKIVDAYMQIFRDCLDDLATEFRFRAVGNGPRRARDRFDQLAITAALGPLFYASVGRAKVKPAAVAPGNADKPVLHAPVLEDENALEDENEGA